jgi:hypothetical protein
VLVIWPFAEQDQLLERLFSEEARQKVEEVTVSTIRREQWFPYIVNWRLDRLGDQKALEIDAPQIPEP